MSENSYSHSHSHHHIDTGQERGELEKKLLFSITLNFSITAIQIVGGLVTGSLSLLGDAMHNFADTFSLVISYFAIKISAKKKTGNSTFGYERVEILIALLNATILIVVSFFLFKEAFIRLLNPVVIDSKWVILVASFGLLANSACAVLLKGHVQKSINVRSAFVHLVSDALVSLAVVVGAVLIYYFEIFWLDSLLVLAIGLYVIREGYIIVAEALAILMQYVPRGIDIEEIQRGVEALEGVKNMHHLHVWGLTERDIHLEAHVEVDGEMRVIETCSIYGRIEKYLLKQHNINHVTLQFESGVCSNPKLLDNCNKV